MADLCITAAEREDLTDLLDQFAAGIEATIENHVVPGTHLPSLLLGHVEGCVMPEYREFIAEQKALWRRVQDWAIKTQNPDGEEAAQS